ncbi:response regulator [Pontibacter diazotrophicus]|uniref:Response regulator n=1 Tax=Pontibacter diazotrophicus TaxID=1400979 RepID=A0A3D8L266_9BACT|nr:response regulator [Pontibacter diazotrophicus]RDV11455.1 response regulator [Pontibacter diazotrophicus]
MKVISRILLVDDDAVYLYITQRLLRQLWAVVEVQTAANGEDALKLLKERTEKKLLPELIISDIEMPVMNGLTFMEELHRLNLVDFNSTKLVLNSSSLIYKSVDRAGVDSAVTFFSKPLTREKLLRIID